jgi:hypothetical protein
MSGEARMAGSEAMRAAFLIMGTAPMRGHSLVLVGHVCPALGVQVSPQGFHGVTEGMLRILYAVVFLQPQHAIDVCCASDIHGLFGQFIHGGERACEPVAVRKVEPIAPGLQKTLTRFSTKSKCHIIALGLTPSHRKRH